MPLTASPTRTVPAAAWTLAQAAAHYRTFTAARLANALAPLQELAAGGIPDAVVALPALEAELATRGL
jgi:hypothetical protein